MAYSENILPKSASYYTLSRASIVGTELILESDGYAEYSISQQQLPKLTSKMLLVAHPSIFSSYYTNDAVQVNLSIVTVDGQRIELLIPVSMQPSGVFNTEIDLPDVEYVTFTYRISSSIPVVIYNWELCAEEASDITAVIDGVEQTIPKLLYDYNTYAYAVAQKELTVGLISCFLHSATDLQGHFTISFFATERCNVHVRIKDNGTTELFSPQVYTVERGYASVSIPHAYLKKTATDHSFSVTMQCTNGQLSIPVRGMLYTIDGGYLATRLLDAGVDIQDVSIRQIQTDATPSEIWAIGFEGDRLLLKKREYSLLSKVNWVAVKDFGEGLQAGVEFYGMWLRRGNSDKFTLETEDTPYVFIIGTDKVLRVYQGQNFEIITELDTDVSSISACQGFSSSMYEEQDQGLLIAYIKNGNVYYRQWLYNATIGEFRWHSAEVLYDKGDASFVSVHRLPDYRVGICVRHGTSTDWYITNRTYVGQSIKTEFVDTSTKAITIATVYETDKAPSSMKLQAVTNEFETTVWYNGFIMTFERPLVYLGGYKASDFIKAIRVYINDVLQPESAIESIEVTSNTVKVLMVNDVRAGSKVLVDFNFHYVCSIAYNGCYAEIEKKYAWELATPTSYISFNDEVNVSVNADLYALVKPLVTTNMPISDVANITVASALELAYKQVYERPLAVADTCSISVTSTLELTVSQVGASPI